MAGSDRWLVWMAVVGTAATMAVAGLLWMIVMHPVAVAQVLARGR